MCLAIPARVLSVADDEAVVSVGGVSRTVSLLALGGGEAWPAPPLCDAPSPLAEGDYVLVHAGFAIERLDPVEAEKTLALFREIAAFAEDPAPPGTASAARAARDEDPAPPRTIAAAGAARDEDPAPPGTASAARAARDEDPAPPRTIAAVGSAREHASPGPAPTAPGPVPPEREE